jgi:hypothetical protein
LRFLAIFDREVEVNRKRTLFSGPSVNVVRFDHPEHCVHKDEGPEVAQAFDVSMVERGEFDLVERRQRWHFRPFDVIVSCPGAERISSHAGAASAGREPQGVETGDWRIGPHQAAQTLAALADHAQTELNV